MSILDQPDRYPVTLSVDYPDRELNRGTTLLRLIVAIPILIVLGLLSGAAFSHTTASGSWQLAMGGLVFLPTLLLIVFRQKYPRWWFDWNLELTRFGARVAAYLALLRDEYPSTDEEQAVHVEIPYPDARRGLDRWLPLVKWFLAIPHYVILWFLGLAALVAVVVAWFTILITGRYPRSIFDFVVGVLRWSVRVTAYAFILATDRYPPFSLCA